MKRTARLIIFSLFVIWTAVNIIAVCAPAGFLCGEAFALMAGGLFSCWLEWQAFKLCSRKGLTYESLEDVRKEEI